MENRSLFILDQDSKELIVNRLEAKKVPEFLKLFKRDMKRKGDTQGREKKQFNREMLYIYLITDPKSIFRDLSNKEKKYQARRFAELDTLWKEDLSVKAAIVKYEELLMLTGIEVAYYNASKGLYSIGQDLDLFNEANERARGKIRELNGELDMGTPDEIERVEAQLNSLIEVLSSNTQEVIKLSTLLPKAYQGLEDLYDKMMKEKQGKKKLYGGGELGSRED